MGHNPYLYLNQGEERVDLEKAYQDLEAERETLQDEGEDFYVRIEVDFTEDERDDIFVQTKEFNVFLTESGAQVHGIGSLNPESKDLDSFSENVLDYIEEKYTEDP
jgi:hypothetical protein